MTLDLSTRCFQCNVFAYNDRFEGEYGVSGYLCLGCIRRMNEALMKMATERFFEEQCFSKLKELESALDRPIVSQEAQQKVKSGAIGQGGEDRQCGARKNGG